MLNQSYSEDPLVAELIDEYGGDAALIYFGLIPYQDREGRLSGDARIIKGRCWPLVERITIEMIEGCLAACHAKQLLIRYECDGRKFICFPNFRKNQSEAKLNREAESRIPPPPADLLRAWRHPREKIPQAAGPTPELRMPLHAEVTQPHAEVPQLPAEENRKEEKRNTFRKAGDPITTVADVEQALSAWQWPLQIRTTERARARRILQAGPIEPHELAEHQPRAATKEPGKRLAYLLGAVEGSRTDAQAEVTKPSPPSARAPPKRPDGPEWREYKPEGAT